MPNIVGVQFKEVGKVYYFSPSNYQFALGDGAIVETARGVEYGKVVIPNKDVADSEVVGELKAVIRKATEEDTHIFLDNQKRRAHALKLCEEKVEKRKLDMKIVDCDYTFDNSKIVFYFTSEGRVDFRELVKDLASVFKIRIELRQIGIRDECKMLGGLGPCGRECCCNCYMGDFERVSIKMAKNQGLSLNPTKISGLCGRLMCCLKFENDYYAETVKLMPKLNSEIDTPDGKATVSNCDILKRKVTARRILPNGDTDIKVYSLDELKVKEHASANESAPADSEDDQDVKSILD